MEEKIQKIIKGVKMPDTFEEGIKEALEKQDEIDKIQTSRHRANEHLDLKKKIEAGKGEIQKKIEKEYRRKFLDSLHTKDIVEQKLQDEAKGRKTLGVVETEELKKGVAVSEPQKELTEEARQQLIIDYLDEVMQLPEFWTGIEKQDEKPQKEEIELLEKRKSHGITGYLISNKITGKKFFVPDLHNLNKNIVDKLPASIKINLKLYNII